MSNQNTINFYYIAEFSIPSKSAYSIHVLKMCDNIQDLNYKLNLIIPNCRSKFRNIKNNYNLKNNFKIISIFKNARINFIKRIIFSLFSAIIVKKNSPNLVITRSLISSFFLTLLKKKHYLEIHGDIYGLTNFLLIKLNFINSKYIIKIIFITKSIADHFKIKKNKYIIMPDAFDEKDFIYKLKKIKKIAKLIYTGSFSRGKGTDTILKIAKFFPKKLFYLYGNKNSKKFNFTKNVRIFHHTKYKNIPKILDGADVLLMPYEKNVFYNEHNKDNIGNFHSPLKMFEYLASGKLLISSNHKVLKTVLKDKINCLIVKNNNISSWIKSIKYAEKNINRVNKITKYAYYEAKNYTWKNRIKNILEYKS